MGFVFFAIMVLAAFIPFGLIGYWVRTGKNGLALALGCLCGGGLVVFGWGSDGRLGLEPLIAMSWAMLFFVPATIGALSGWLLGWLMRRRDER